MRRDGRGRDRRGRGLMGTVVQGTGVTVLYGGQRPPRRPPSPAKTAGTARPSRPAAALQRGRPAAPSLRPAGGSGCCRRDGAPEREGRRERGGVGVASTATRGAAGTACPF